MNATSVAAEETPPPPPLEVPPDPRSQTVPFVTGMVTGAFAPEGCAWLVRIDDTFAHPANGMDLGIPELILPIALDPQYAKEGLRLRFTYRLSRASSGACTKGVPAILENVAVIE